MVHADIIVPHGGEGDVGINLVREAFLLSRPSNYLPLLALEQVEAHPITFLYRVGKKWNKKLSSIWKM